MSGKHYSMLQDDKSKIDICVSSRRFQRAFTLMEVLIVVAIIAILVVIAIPVFNTQLDRAREATCSANRRALQAEIAVLVLDGSAASYTEAYNSVYNQADTEYTCPDNGVFSLVSLDSAAIKCDVHTAGSFTNEQLFNSFIRVINNGNLKNSNVYSTLNDDPLRAFLAGLTTGEKKALEGKSWTYSKSDSKLYIYDGDITTVGSKDYITIQAYDLKTNKITSRTGRFLGTKDGIKVLAPY